MNQPTNISDTSPSDTGTDVVSLRAQIELLKAEEQALVLGGASNSIERYRVVTSGRLTLEHRLMSLLVSAEAPPAHGLGNVSSSSKSDQGADHA